MGAFACSTRKVPSPTSPSETPPPPSAALPPPVNPRLTDPLWLAARGEDSLDRVRLAQAAGASGLLEGLDDGGETALVALAALPEAPDAELALQRLAEVAASKAPANLHAVLETILAIAGEPRRSRELLDPEGVRAAGEALVELAGRTGLAPEDRALAISAARALAERGYVDEARIPTDLDPR
jgi:hypothetical protein